jgi:hypothetical protein
MANHGNMATGAVGAETVNRLSYSQRACET